jgi:ferredoxin-NADP reductase
VKLFELELADAVKFRAGQFYDVRLTAPDGYQAQRSYSITSSPDDSGSIELAVELIADGEVTSYFHEAVEIGEQIEVRGPIGGHFTWNPRLPKPVLFIAGGSGIAPIMSMLRHRQSSGSHTPALLLFSVRSHADILFREELEKMSQDDPELKLIITLTLGAPLDWSGETRRTGRIDRKMIDAAVKNLASSDSLPDRAYICGGSNFVEAIGNLLLDTGMGLRSIRTERFGP